jgi:acyl-coenzyme A thioesterase PaaI-like protein
MTKDTGKVNIHGKEYETVASRVNRFRTAHKDNYSIITEIIEANESLVIMKASILEKEGRVIATGHAEESRASSAINRTSALENCETSAIGRALASFGNGGTEFASADEVAQAIINQSAAGVTEAVPHDQPATDKQRETITNQLYRIGISVEDQKGYLTEEFGVPVPLTKEGASFVIGELLVAK